MKIRLVTPKDLKKLQALNKKIFVNNPKFDDEFDDDLVTDFMDTPRGKKYMQGAIKAKDGCLFVAEEGEEEGGRKRRRGCV